MPNDHDAELDVVENIHIHKCLLTILPIAPCIHLTRIQRYRTIDRFTRISATGTTQQDSIKHPCPRVSPRFIHSIAAIVRISKHVILLLLAGPPARAPADAIVLRREQRCTPSYTRRCHVHNGTTSVTALCCRPSRSCRLASGTTGHRRRLPPCADDAGRLVVASTRTRRTNRMIRACQPVSEFQTLRLAVHGPIAELGRVATCERCVGEGVRQRAADANTRPPSARWRHKKTTSRKASRS